MKQSTAPTPVQTTARATKTSATKRTSKKEASTPQPSAATSPISITVGLDLGDRHSHFCVLDDGCQPLEQGRVAMSRKDLTFAGIEKHDDRGRTACIHGFRTSFATLLNRGGVAPRVAMAAMRHSSIDLTMSVYTDARLLDVAGALMVLPELPLEVV